MGGKGKYLVWYGLVGLFQTDLSIEVGSWREGLLTWSSLRACAIMNMAYCLID